VTRLPGPAHPARPEPLARQPQARLDHQRPSSSAGSSAACAGHHLQPSIFQKAMESGDAYDSQLRTLVGEGTTILDSYLDPRHRRHPRCAAIPPPRLRREATARTATFGRGGPVARPRHRGTITAARHLSTLIRPAQPLRERSGHGEGLPAIRQMISGVAASTSRCCSARTATARSSRRTSRASRRPRATCRRSRRSPRSSSAVDTEIDHRLKPSHRRRPGPGGARRRSPTPSWPTSFPRAVSAAPGGTPRRPRARKQRTAVALDVDQERRLPRHALHRRPDRPRHRSTHPDATLTPSTTTHRGSHHRHRRRRRPRP